MPSEVQIWTGTKYVPEGAIASAPLTALEAAQNSKKAAIDRVYYAKLHAGYSDTVETVTLAATQNDQNQFGNLVTMLLLAGTLDTTMIDFTDNDGAFHQRTFASFKSLMLRYGAWCKETWGACAWAKQLVESATMVEEVEVVQYE